MFEFTDTNIIESKEIDLILSEKKEAVPEKEYLPCYVFDICLHGTKTKVGIISLRVGYNRNIKYGGNIGYGVFEDYRGHHYAAKACMMLKNLAQSHGHYFLIITCDPDNISSRKTCEYIGAELLEIVDLPEWTEMYKRGKRTKCKYLLEYKNVENCHHNILKIEYINEFERRVGVLHEQIQNLNINCNIIREIADKTPCWTSGDNKEFINIIFSNLWEYSLIIIYRIFIDSGEDCETIPKLKNVIRREYVKDKEKSALKEYFKLVKSNDNRQTMEEKIRNLRNVVIAHLLKSSDASGIGLNKFFSLVMEINEYFRTISLGRIDYYNDFNKTDIQVLDDSIRNTLNTLF